MTTPATSTAVRDVPRWLWLWFPPLIVVAQVGTKMIDEDFYKATMRHETGIVELSTVLFLVIATIFGVRLFLDRERLPAKWMGTWMLLFTLGCIYFGGEEASWGQHYFGWGTPEALAAVNAQHETNLHNISGLFDQVPRALLGFGVFIFGVIVPIVMRVRTGEWRSPAGPLGPAIPTAVCVPAAILTSVIAFPERIVEAFGHPIPYWMDISPGETKEYYFGLFLMLYAWSLWRRRTQPTAPPAAQAS